MTAAKDVTTVPMTAVDEARLIELEGIVSAGMTTFLAVGSALMEIRDARLYRCTHDSFERYLEDRWQISRPRAYQLIEAARLSTVVDTAGLPSPTSERQVRPLTGLNDPQVHAAWKKAVEDSNGRPTGQSVARTREQMFGPRFQPTDRGTARGERPRLRPPLPDTFRRAFYELNKRAQTLVGYSRDDRWDSHVETLRTATRSDLGRLISELQKVYDKLGTIDRELPVEKAAVLIDVGPNTAAATCSEGSEAVRMHLQSLGVRFQREQGTHRTIFLADRADELAAAMRANGYTVEVRR